MQVGGEQEREAENGEEVADQHALLALRRIDRGDEAETELLGDHRAGDLQRRDGEPRRHAEHGADQELLAEQDHHRPDLVQIDLIGGAMERQHDGGKHQRHGEPQPRRDHHLAEPRQQHQHGADAREHQQEGGGERGQERDVDAHQPRSARLRSLSASSFFSLSPFFRGRGLG